MSGHSQELLSQTGSPGREFIQKPFTPQDLLDKVHAILATRQGSSGAAAAPPLPPRTPMEDR